LGDVASVVGDVAPVAEDLAPLLIAAKMDDRQLVLNKDQLKKLSRDISDFSDDERELFFSQIWNGIKNAGANIFDDVKNLFKAPSTQPSASETAAPTQDDRELAEYVSRHFGDLTEDNRELLLGTLLSVGVPLLSSLFGGRTEDDRELKTKVKVKCRDDDRELKNKVKIKGCDRELILTEDDLNQLKQITSQDVLDMTDDGRELFFGALFNGIKNAATNVFDDVKNLFKAPPTQPPASESQAPADDDRELIKYVSQHFGDLTEDNRELFLGALASVAVPLISSLFGGDRELKTKVKVKCRDDDRELKTKVKVKGCDPDELGGLVDLLSIIPMDDGGKTKIKIKGDDANYQYSF